MSQSAAVVGESSGEPAARYSIDALWAAVAGNARLAQGVADAFLKIRPELESRLARAIEGDDRDTALQAAHELRGMAAMMGANRLAAAAAAVVAYVGVTLQAPADGAQSLMQALTAEWDLVASALNGVSTHPQPLRS